MIQTTGVGGSVLGKDAVDAAVLVVSASAFVLSIATTIAQRRRGNMEIARSLHVDLTSGPVGDARRPLGEVAFGVRKAWEANPENPDVGGVIPEDGPQADEIRHQYFVLLWCFERIWHGYQVIRKDRVLGKHAGDDFAEMLAWHVRTWAWSLPAVKRALQPTLGTIFDGDSAKAFAALTDEVLQPGDHEFLRRRLLEMGLTPIGAPAWAEGAFPSQNPA